MTERLQMLLSKDKTYFGPHPRSISCVIVSLLCAFLVSTAINLNAQVELNPSALNFGATGPWTEWIMDVHVTSKVKDFVLRTTYSSDYEILYTSKSLQPDSSIVMRVKFNPRMKGEFKDDIKIYFASMGEPVILPVKASVDYLNPEGNIPCPDFSRTAADCCPANMFVVEVRDKESGAPIPGADVLIGENGISRLKLKSGTGGKVSQTLPVGYYNIQVECEGFTSASYEGYINQRHSWILLEVSRLKLPVPVHESSAPVEVSSNDSVMFTELPVDKFNLNNIVFLLDVSSSMAQGEKLELMKGALNKLTSILRPGDKITLVSYADNARILLPTTTGDQKATITGIVSSLSVAGATSGARGFKLAYRILKEEMIKNGNNQLVVITDGVFQPSDQKEIARQTAKSAKKNLTTSIVGIQCVSFATLKLSEISTLGHGSYLAIDSEEDLGVLIDEMKLRSSK